MAYIVGRAVYGICYLALFFLLVSCSSKAEPDSFPKQISIERVIYSHDAIGEPLRNLPKTSFGDNGYGGWFLPPAFDHHDLYLRQWEFATYVVLSEPLKSYEPFCWVLSLKKEYSDYQVHVGSSIYLFEPRAGWNLYHLPWGLIWENFEDRAGASRGIVTYINRKTVPEERIAFSLGIEPPKNKKPFAKEELAGMFDIDVYPGKCQTPIEYKKSNKLDNSSSG